MAYKNCYTLNGEGVSYYRPLFWFTNEDRRTYEKLFNVVHSRCYCEYGFKRTGCVCCPFGGTDVFHELHAVKIHEPKMYVAARGMFGDSYKYQKEYYKFRREMNLRGRGRRTLF